MGTANEKGQLLEDGVSVIEQAILAVDAGAKASDLKIEPRKIINHHGVRHEIDLHITVVKGRGYDSIFVFECKNWKDPVGKNEIVVFSEKVKVATAQRGFFIAREFTADARAQAALDPRVELVTATADVLAEVESVSWFHFLEVDYKSVTVSLTYHLADDDPPPDGEKKPIDFDRVVAQLDGKPLDLRAYVLRWRDEAQDRRTARWGSPLQPAGEHALSTSESREFEVDQLVVDGKAVSRAAIEVAMLARIHRPGIRARVAVAGRGRALQLEPVKLESGEAVIWISGSQRTEAEG